ncbi:biliverdin-producing heme oxygenase [Noviherbaspirillum galbum]|uniref:Biliverdin-producing heme oxygenase n=1 Tax=Noviherbaspirillum galbum TaxID=2709383 RepID=A0A6B3SQY3_9BURK|nr:biliverdin-producing heme oxygenase [Noviherbaspirillum galbum]NEX63163.1 biliverdin-producing heme oxygenase [Noviherbaspirillum galbum]
MSESISPALMELRRATSSLHEQLENLLDINREGAGRDEYLSYLEDMLGWLKAVEPALWNMPWPAVVAARERAGKLERIEADLRWSGMSSEEIHRLPVADFRPSFERAEARYGIAYVVEGAQLGVRVLARRLAPALDGWEPVWLQGYGEQSSLRWKTFVACAEAELQGAQARQAAAEYARQAFSSLLEWFTIRREARRNDMTMRPTAWR